MKNQKLFTKQFSNYTLKQPILQNLSASKITGNNGNGKINTKLNTRITSKLNTRINTKITANLKNKKLLFIRNKHKYQQQQQKQHMAENSSEIRNIKKEHQTTPITSTEHTAPTAPTAENTFKRYPLTYKQSFLQWWKGPSLDKAEDDILSLLSFYPGIANTENSIENQSDNRVAKSSLVPIGDNLYINEFQITRKNEPIKNELVILHGYGAGLGFFYRNFDALSSRFGWRVSALDLLGYGRSSRPKFKIDTKKYTDINEQIDQTENFFIDSLESWRKSRNINSFTLLAHSLGGYLGVAYIKKYPNRVNRLILASPAGVPDSEHSINDKHLNNNSDSNNNNKNNNIEKSNNINATPTTNAKNPTTNATSNPQSTQNNNNPYMHNETTMNEEFLASQDETTTHHNNDNNNNNNNNNNNKNMNSNENNNNKGKYFVSPSDLAKKALTTSFVYLWDKGVSPFSIIRVAGPLGPKFTSGWTSRRFSQLKPNELSLLHIYSYKIFSAPGSGEYALSYLLAPGAFARRPLIRTVSEVNVPTAWIYGENDWMDSATGLKAVNILKKKYGNNFSSFYLLENSGHHVYLDNPTGFNKIVLEELKKVELAT